VAILILATDEHGKTRTVKIRDIQCKSVAKKIQNEKNGTRRLSENIIKRPGAVRSRLKNGIISTRGNEGACPLVYSPTGS
jgi:hypothetical protein